MKMKLSKKADLIKSILDEKFPQLKLSSPFCDRGQPWILVSYWDLQSTIAIDSTAEEVTEILMREKILDMLKGAKQLIEKKIESLER